MKEVNGDREGDAQTLKIKIIGEGFSFNNEIRHDDLVVDLSGEFYLSSTGEKSDDRLKENDAFLIESNVGGIFVKKGTVKIEVVE